MEPERTTSSAQIIAAEVTGLMKDLMGIEHGRALDREEKRFTEADVAMGMLAGAITACQLSVLMGPTPVRDVTARIAGNLGLLPPNMDGEDDDNDDNEEE